MKPGTPQFVGQRLKEAREGREMTASALSQLLGVSRQAISQYEKGPETPSPPVMRRISEVLRFPIHYFLRPVHVTTDGTLFFRSQAATTKSARLRAKRRLNWTREIVRYFRGFVNLPIVNYPQLSFSGDPLQINETQIEEAAAAVRRHWRLGDGPISDIVLLLENNGTIIVRHDLAVDTIDGFSMWSLDERTPYVVLNSAKDVAVRSRYDVAHELGHLILHRNTPAGCLDRSELFALIEQQAHAFARAFLLPAKTFAADMFSPSLDAFRAIKPKWKVSIQAMIFRAKDLRLLTREQEQRIWPNLARRGWRTHEPLDDTLAPEVPRLLRRSVELLVSSGAATCQDIVFQNALPADDIEELVGLPKGYLGGAEDSAPQGGGEPTIIRFPSTG